ncbi:VOC family protein [Microbacterium hominis]|uniref:VOC family protein n=1 Tax=Microbacterium hominis TaxID=162426 RepID=UPI001CC2C741|nr:VOC family protein [Microbacterium hominis]
MQDSPAEVDAVYAALVAAGHDGHVAPFDAFWGQRYATVLDPDGNAVDLFAPLPAA